jgi:hypothetical protein
MRVFPYCYSFVDRTPALDSWHTQPDTFEISLRNECSRPWFKSADITGNDSGLVVHLGTGKADVTDDANPFANQDHSSPFCTSGSTGWIGSDCNRIEMVEDRVNQGEVATFRFAAGVPILAQPIESHFTPVVEEFGWMPYQQDTMLRVNNNPYRATWQSQEPAEPFTMQTGETRNLKVSFTNEGHKPWQQSNAQLGIVGPDDNSESYDSPFYHSSWSGQDRPAALDQAEVAPGDAGSFSFTVQASDTPGTYKFRVRPVADGEWWMEEQTMDVYWMITVEGEPITNDCSRFISDVTIPDDTVVAPGETVQKTWQLENCGDTTWNSYRAVRIDGTFGPESFDVSSVSPGERADIGVEITVPTEPGTHKATYKLEGPRGQFGTNFFIQVTVSDNPGGISVPVEPAPVPNEPCAVPFFSQNDPAWKYHPLRTAGQCSAACGTIGACGCTLTSTAMVLRYYGANTNPAKLSDCMGTRACLFQWGVAPGCSGGKAQHVHRGEFSWEQMRREINQNQRPVILGMTRGLYEEHWVVVTRGSGDSPANYTIHDPWELNGANISLNKYAGWDFVAMSVYSGQQPCALTSTADTQDMEVVAPPESEVYQRIAAQTEQVPTSNITGTVHLYRSTGVTMTLALTTNGDENTEMLIWTDTISSTTWQPFAPYVEVPVSETMYVQFRNQAGNVSDVVSNTLYPGTSPSDVQNALNPTSSQVYLPLIRR